MIVLTATGCGESPARIAEKRLVGRWKLDTSSLGSGNPLLALAAGSLKAEFDFRADLSGTFEGPMNAKETFTWKVNRVDGSTVFLGRTDKSEETRILFSDDNTVTVPSSDPQKMPAKFTFRRVAK